MIERFGIVLALAMLIAAAILGAFGTSAPQGLGIAPALIFNACLISGGWLIGRYARGRDS